MLEKLLSSEATVFWLFAFLLAVQLAVLVFAIVKQKESLWIAFFLILLSSVGLMFPLCYASFSFLGGILLWVHCALFFIALTIRTFFMTVMK